MFMYSFEVRNALGDPGNECAFSQGACGCSPGSICFFLLPIVLPLDHALYALRQLVVSVFVDDLLEDAFPTVCLALVYPTQQIHLAVPRHRPGSELVSLTSEVTVDLVRFWSHQSVRNMNLAHYLKTEVLESFLAFAFLIFEHLFV